MVKETIKNFYGLADVTIKEELQAALDALDNTEKVEEVSTAKVELGEATLDTGDAIYFPGDNLTEGSVIYTDEAQEELHPAGDVVIDNGDVVSIGEEGIVTGIVTPDGDEEEEIDNQEEETEELQTPETVEEVLTALQPVFDDLYARLDALEGGNAELSKENVELKKTNESIKEDLATSEGKLEKLSKASAAKPFTDENKTVINRGFSKATTAYDRALQSGNFTTSNKNNK